MKDKEIVNALKKYNVEIITYRDIEKLKGKQSKIKDLKSLINCSVNYIVKKLNKKLKL